MGQDRTGWDRIRQEGTGWDGMGQDMTTTYIYKIWYQILRFKQIIFSKYATNMKTTITQRCLKNLGLLLSLFEFDNFSFVIDKIDNIIYTSVSHDQNSLQWQCSILIT